MREVHSNWTSRLVPFSAAAIDCLERNCSQDGDAYIFADISKDGQLGWVVRGQALEVFKPDTGVRLAAWCFGASLKDPNVVVTTVTEYMYDNSLKLLVGLETSSHAGMLCIFDIKTSKVLKAIDFPHKVTAVEPVTSVGGEEAPLPILSQHLRCFCGVVAVGSRAGHLYLVDMCLDDEGDASDEVNPSPVLYLDPRQHNLEQRRFDAVKRGHHLCLELQEDSHSRGFYHFRKPDGSSIKTFVADDVCVSMLKFVKQTGTLVVGFNFGCFQLWRLYIPVLEYSSRYEDNLLPVTHITYQEPENDPRNFCYMWIARGPMQSDGMFDQIANISLYQLAYSRKTWYDDVGVVFEELLSVTPRFEHDLTADPGGVTDCGTVGSRLISCYTMEDPYSMAQVQHEDSMEEGTSCDLSLCVFVWEATSEDANTQSKCCLGLFDMNRWYHSQMPTSIRLTSVGLDMCSFFGFFSMEDVMEAMVPDNLLAVHVQNNSLTKFQSTAIPTPEQHFYPSALGFNICAVGETGLVSSKYLGIQRQILSDLSKKGSQAVVDPDDFYNLCLYAGLLPRNVELTASSATVAMKREALLSIAVDHNMISLVTSCIVRWAEGELASAGCSLRVLLDWAWSKVAYIKESLDRLCTPLYDWSDVQLDRQTEQLLHQHQVALSHMVTIFQCLSNQTAPTTLQGRQDLEVKLNVVSLISQHLQAVLWFYNNCLLPEYPESETLASNQYSYPSKALGQAFEKRREELHNLHSDPAQTNLLLIDGLIQEMGASIKVLWETEGGSGQYPPQSLHALLNIYLLEGVPQLSKHIVVLYLLLDLVSLANDDIHEAFSEKVMQFSQAFCLSESLMRLVQGMWLLDHKDFEPALLILLDPMVNPHMTSWQHRYIVKAFLYQGQNKMALKYMRIKKPPLVTPEDVKLRLTILLANGLTSEAFAYQRVCCDQLSAEDLRSHLFLGCQQTKKMDSLLQLPLKDDEECHLVEYLENSKEPRSLELLLMHYLQRSRFVEAIQLNARLKQNIMGEMSPQARERAAARNSIVDCYTRILPRVQRKLTFGLEVANRRALLSRREVTRPTPLSMTVNRAKQIQAVSQATLITAVLEKVHETREAADEEASPAMRDCKALRDPGPFICTPVTPKTHSRVSAASEVVFPSTSAASTSRQEVKHRITPPFRRSLVQSSPVSPDSSKRRLSKYYIRGADALSLLQTPVVRRKTHSKTPQTIDQATPQSILKVRQVVARRSPSPSPQVDKDTKVKHHDDMSMPTPPRYRPSQTTGLVAAALGTPKTLGTPKQLRFSEPQKDADSPETSPEQISQPELSPRGVKDRSPTPERTPPKMPPSMASMEMEVTSHPVMVDSEAQMDESIAQDVFVDDDVMFHFEKTQPDGEVECASEAMEITQDTDTEPLRLSVSSEEDIEEPLTGKPLLVTVTPRASLLENRSEQETAVSNSLHVSNKSIQKEGIDQVTKSEIPADDASNSLYPRVDRESSDRLQSELGNRNTDEVTCSKNVELGSDRMDSANVNSEHDYAKYEKGGEEVRNGPDTEEESLLVESVEPECMEERIENERDLKDICDEEVVVQGKGEIITETSIYSIKKDSTFTITTVHEDHETSVKREIMTRSSSRTASAAEIEDAELSGGKEEITSDMSTELEMKTAQQKVDVSEVLTTTFEISTRSRSKKSEATVVVKSDVDSESVTDRGQHKADTSEVLAEISTRSRSRKTEEKDDKTVVTPRRPLRSSRASAESPTRRSTRLHIQALHDSGEKPKQYKGEEIPLTPKSGKNKKRTPVRRSTRSSEHSYKEEKEAPSSGDQSEQREELEQPVFDTPLQSERSQQESPLSSGSFMMTLRSGRKESKEPQDPPILEEVEETDENPFTFSEPTTLNISSKAEPNKIPTTPIQSFVFSPPLTRSRSGSRRQSLATSRREESILSILPVMEEKPMTKEDTPVAAPKTRTQKKTKKPPKKIIKYRSPHNSPTDSPINFLTPPELEEEENTRRLRPRQSTHPVPALRPKKYNTRKKVLKLW